MHVAGLDRGQLHEIFHALSRARAAQERLAVLLGGADAGGRSRTFAKASEAGGREAAAVGSAYGLRRRTDGTGDIIAHSDAATGAVFLLGGTPLEFFRQRLARATGPSAGRDADAGWTDLQRGILGSVSPPGVMLEVMAGITLAFRLAREDRVGIVYGTAGATATGAWHEGLNFAAVQRCPMVVVTERHPPDARAPDGRETRVASFTDKAPGYGIAAESVDGHDVLAVYEATERALTRARSGEGVTLVELRYGPVVDGADPDPIERFRRRLVEARWGTPEELDAIAERARAEVAGAAVQAAAEPVPPAASAADGVYSDVVVTRPWFRSTEILPNGA